MQTKHKKYQPIEEQQQEQRRRQQKMEMRRTTARETDRERLVFVQSYTKEEKN